MDRLPTLRQVFNDYLVSRQNLKPSTILDYRKRLKCVEDWLDLPVSAITKDMVEEKHREISIKGKAQANVTFRVVRALLNYARSKYENEHEQPILKTNVVSRLTEVRAWNKVRGRRTIITAAQMPDWWRAVSCLRNRTVRDYLMLLMLTGLRRSEAASLQWKDVDLQAGFLRVLDPKNGEHHELPLSDFLWDMLRVRKAHARKENPHVFPGRVPGCGLSNCFKSFDRVFVGCGFRFKLHDLRRTFLTTAHELKIDLFTLRQLANHKANDDITALYVIQNYEMLRPTMQKITDLLLSRAGVRKVGNVVSIVKGVAE